MSAYPILIEAERRLSALVGSLDPADLDRPTPCAGWDVRTLLGHTLSSVEAFAAAADGAPGPDAAALTGERDVVGDDPVGATKQATTRSQAAWADLADPGAIRTTHLGPLPAGTALAIAAFSTIVHGWDLAVATGRDGELPADLVTHARAVADQIVPGLRAEPGGPGMFQPELPAPPDATPTRRLMAFLGRPA